MERTNFSSTPATQAGTKRNFSLWLALISFIVAVLVLGVSTLAQVADRLPGTLQNLAPVNVVITVYQAIKPMLTGYSGPRYIAFLGFGVAIYWLLPSARWRSRFLLVYGMALAILLVHLPLALVAVVVAAVFLVHLGAKAAARSHRTAVAIIVTIAVAYVVLQGTPALGLWPTTYSRFVGYYLLLQGFFMFLPLKFIHYIWDVAQGRSRVYSLEDFALWIFFFPSFRNAPFERIQSFVKQKSSLPDSLTGQDVRYGLKRIAIGALKGALGYYIFKYLAPVEVFAAPENFDATRLWLAAYSYSIALYLNFAGFADAMIGSSRLLGYRLSENFLRPYWQTDTRGFWRGWNVTTSFWLRDYVYIPLGGNRRHVYFNLMATMLVAGVWHHLSWNFMIWGFLHGLGLCASRAWYNSRRPSRQEAKLSGPPRWALIQSTRLWLGTATGWAITFTFVTLVWIFHHNGYQAINVTTSLTMIGRMFGI